MRYFCGLDLGQLADYSALSIIERIEDREFYRYECRHIERFPLGLPYPRIVEHVRDLLARTPLARNCQLVIDNSGVGVAVADMFSEAGIPYIGITITGGVGWHRESWRRWHVSKSLLVSTIQKFLSSEALGISRQLPAAALLRSELQNFRVKVSKAANEIYESREGEHDDITCSLAVALFVAEHPGQRFVPIGD
jgi:hypothetical protein